MAEEAGGKFTEATGEANNAFELDLRSGSSSTLQQQ
jgi:hypothetical protein